MSQTNQNQKQEAKEEEEALTPSRRSLHRSISWSVRSSPNPNPNPSTNPPNPRKPARRPLPPLLPLRRPISGDLLRTPPPTTNYLGDLSRISDHIYLGSDSAARDRDALRRHGITHVLNCVGTPRCPDYFRGDLVYKTLYLHDSPAEDITSVLYDAFDYLEEVRSLDGARAFVHCSKGASRSAALVIAYLIWSSSMSFQDALAYVRSARSVADPNLGFASQLLQCQSRVHALPPSPGSVVRVYRMAPHSPYDPLHLVPKAVDRPWLPRFDSRGAFLVVHVGRGIFIWLGSFCERVMAVRANEAARQIVRYERVKVSIFTVREGSESSEFWNVLKNGEDFCDITVNIDVGNRKVELYDLDFEIFRRAIKGGVVPPAPMTGSESRLPARESAWSRVRKKFLRRRGGITEIGNKDDEEDEEQKENTEFQSPSSLSSITSGDTASTLSTFSPASSSSFDLHNLSPSGSDFTPILVSKLPPLHSRKVKNNEEATGSLQSLAVRRGSNPPCLVLLPPVEGGKCRLSPRDIVRDWCLLSPFVSDLEEHRVAMDIEQPTSSGCKDDRGDEVSIMDYDKDRIWSPHPIASQRD